MAPPKEDILLCRHAYVAKSFENLLMNYWLEWFLNWHGASLGQGDLS